MLHTKTVEPGTLGVIQELFAKQYMQPYLLVGGTALALQLGHRSSTDIDLFTNKKHDPEQLLELLNQDFDVFVRNTYKHALFVNINAVKADIVRQNCNIIDEPLVMDGVRMASLKEIAPMKLLAISNRGRKRDFIDLFFLLQHFSLEQMLLFYKEKFENDNFYLILRSLTYFVDADKDTDLKYYFKQKWGSIKKAIIKEATKISL